jgi:hypothetical protein
MRQLTRAALGAVFAFGVVSAAVAQGPTAVPATQPGVPAAGFEMPGTAVGRPSVQAVGSPVGSRLPTVGTKLPPAVGADAAKNPFAGNWPTVDPKVVVAPYPTQPTQAADFWDKLQQRWAALFDPPKPPQTTWVPGTTRRARERRERAEATLERWQRD